MNNQEKPKDIRDSDKKKKRKSPTPSVGKTALQDSDLSNQIVALLQSNNQLLHKCIMAVTGGNNNEGESAQGTSPKAMERIMAAKMIKRTTCVKVELKCNFVRIISIDTVNQEFEAEMFILSKWEDPSFNGIEGRPSELFNECLHWRPHLILKNCNSGLHKETVTFSVQNNVAGYEHPVVFMGWNFQAILKEKLELENYPVDVQDLSVLLTSEHSLDECELCEDTNDMSTVNVSSFTAAQEWSFFRHVQFESTYTHFEYESVSRHPLLCIQCRVARKLWYFVWNVVFIMLVICSLTFSCYAIAPSSSDRLAINITLMLTGVTFKLVVTQNLPKISYLTYLDIYVLFSLVFLGLHGMTNSILLYLVVVKSPQMVKKIDYIVILHLVALIVLFHFLFGLKIYIRTRKQRAYLRKQDSLYIKRLKKVGKLRSSSFDVGEKKAKKAPV